MQNPAVYSGPPHLLSPWGSAGRGGGSGLLKDTASDRPPFWAPVINGLQCRRNPRAGA